MIRGQVIKTTGKIHVVKTTDNEYISCSIKGKFRIKNIVTTNPVAVGDIVDVEILDGNKTGLIVKIYERRNYIIRKSIKLSKEAHILASNVDMVFLMVTVNHPPTSTMFIDRFLLSAEAYRIPAIILFNKYDIYSEEEKSLLNELINIYEEIGYKCFIISAKNEINILPVKKLMQNNTVVIAGHSGIGKSTLINILNSSLRLKTEELSVLHKRGQHTTTFTEMYELDNGGYVIDTPGIKGFGIVDFKKEELFHFFPEIFKISKYCKYNNCQHINEPDCAVKKAVEANEISRSRYRNYLSIMFDEYEEKYRKPH